jgi:hypothetical protein
MNPVLARAQERRRRALRIIEELDLINRWSRFGEPVVVGSVSTGLVVAPDIDLEVYADSPQIAQGFQVMAEVAESRNVVGVTFKNGPETRGSWLYWEIRCLDEDGVVWTIENFFCGPGDPYAHWAERLSEALEKVLTREHRVAILTVKEALCERGTMKNTKSFDIYRAVVEGEIRSVDEFSEWVKTNKAPGIVHWAPQVSR